MISFFHCSARHRTLGEDPAGCAGSVRVYMGQEVLNKHAGEEEKQTDGGIFSQTARNNQVSISERTNMSVGDVRKVSAIQTLKTRILQE